MRHLAIVLGPFGIGMVMGLMMLWMLHMQLTGDQSRGPGALLVFVGAHVVVLGLGLAVPFVASPRLRQLLGRLHRPSLAHVGVMLLGAGTAAGLAHVIIHLGAL